MLDIVHRLLREGHLSRAWLRGVLAHDRHRLGAGGDADAGWEEGRALIDRWVEDGEARVGDLEAIAHAHAAGGIAVELLREAVEELEPELPERVARVVARGGGRLSLPGGMALLALVGGVEHRTARWQRRYVEELLRSADRATWERVEAEWAYGENAPFPWNRTTFHPSCRGPLPGTPVPSKRGERKVSPVDPAGSTILGIGR